MASMRRFTGFAGFVKNKESRRRRRFRQKALHKTPSLQQKLKFLSGGNQQKVVVAKWLIRNCDILIFDEPTRGIDIGAKQEIYALLNELAQAGKTIIMISSELPEILKLSHRIVVMCEGRVTGNFRPRGDAGKNHETGHPARNHGRGRGQPINPRKEYVRDDQQDSRQTQGRDFLLPSEAENPRLLEPRALDRGLLARLAQLLPGQ